MKICFFCKPVLLLRWWGNVLKVHFSSACVCGFTSLLAEVKQIYFKRIAYADDLIVDLLMKIKQDKAYVFDTTVNFKWGTQAHVSAEDFDFGAALNKMMDVLDNKIKKEKDKVQEK